jgi:hypothetical protein
METLDTGSDDGPFDNDIPMFIGDNEELCDTQISANVCSDEQKSDEESGDTEYSDTGEYSGDDVSDEEYNPIQAATAKTVRTKTNVWPPFRMPTNKKTPKKQCTKLLLTCKFCPKSFTEGYKLKRHENTHIGLKPYACRECGKCFSQSGNRNTHMDSVHNKMKHTCKICKDLFSNASNLGHHMDSVHGYAPRPCCVKCNMEMSGDVARHMKSKRCKRLALELQQEKNADVYTSLDILNDACIQACSGATAP